MGKRCVSECPDDVLPAQDPGDSKFGRACISEGGSCNDAGSSKSGGVQCKPPQSLGDCLVSTVTIAAPRCTVCKTGKFLVEGKCVGSLRCKGQFRERGEGVTSTADRKCGCNALSDEGTSAVDKHCYRCTVLSRGSTMTQPVASGAPS